MTSLAEGGAQSATRNRLLWLALALSLTLNIFFVGGLVWSQMAVRPPPSFAERIVEAGAALDLSAEQRGAFQQFAANVQERTKLMRETNQPLFRRIWDELAKPQPDQALIGQLVDEASENRHAYQKDVSAALSTFLSTLTPEQRTQFVALARHHADAHTAPLRRLVMP